MNGIVHPCSHPEDKAPPETEEEMMLEIFKYTERVVNMVRPRKLLMIAVGMFNIRAPAGHHPQIKLINGERKKDRKFRYFHLDIFHLFERFKITNLA